MAKRRKKKDSINQDKIEEEYGLSYALFKAFPELNTLLKKAVAGSWTPGKFQVELRQTGWFKKHSDVWRENTALKYADPASYKDRLNATSSSVRNLMGQFGVQMSNAALARLSERALLFGLDDGQIRDLLAANVKPSAAGHYGGQLSAIEGQLRNTALKNGVRIGGGQLNGWMQAIVRGDASQEQFQTHLRDLAAQTFSLYGEQIKGGVDLADVASPYVQSMAEMLELNPAELDLFDPTIRRALSGVADKDGKKVATSISDFEDSLRKDTRWQYTKSAKNQAQGYVASLSKLWGLQ